MAAQHVSDGTIYLRVVVRLDDPIKRAVGICRVLFAVGGFLPLAIDDEEVVVLARRLIGSGPPITILIALVGAGHGGQ